VGAGYSSTPTLTFNGCTLGSGGIGTGQPPVVEVQIGGANNAGTSAWCFDSNAQPGKAWAGITNMEPPPTAQGDSASHNSCAKPTGGGNLYTASGLTQWETLNFVNFQRTSDGSECSGITTKCFPSSTVNTQNVASGLCPANCVLWVAGAQFSNLVPGNPVPINGSSFMVGTVYSATLMSVNNPPGTLSNALLISTLNGGTNSGSPDLHLCAGTPSPYTGIYISNGQLVIPQ
jgi:hypothetical protein